MTSRNPKRSRSWSHYV